MSTFMVSNKTLSMLSDLIARYYINSDSMGFHFPMELKMTLKEDVFSAELIFNRLAELNIKSLSQRYPSDYDEMVGKPEYYPIYDIWHRPVWDMEQGVIMVADWYYQFLKSLRCYLYQCCEGDCYKDDLYKALDHLSVDLAYFIATNQPEYELAEWD